MNKEDKITEKEISDKEETQILYNTRSEEAEEVIGHMPHWIIRWGIAVIGGFILLLFIIAANIKYPETIVSEISITPLNLPLIVHPPSDGIIKKIAITDSQPVYKGQSLIILSDDSSGLEYELKAGMEGKALFFSDLKENMHIRRQDPLVVINPLSSNVNDFTATGVIKASNRAVISIGQTINVQLSAYPSETYGTVKGKIYRIAPVAFRDQYVFNIIFENGFTTTKGKRIDIQDRQTGTGNIIIKDKTILTRLLEKIKI